MRTVAVLMSTYNGSRFIMEQIDSLLSQNMVQTKLIIRDDGSTDKLFLEDLAKLEKRANITVIWGKNVGAEKSFHRLCLYALKSCQAIEYYAFCDQDDVWKQDKLFVAVNTLEKYSSNKPNTYFSNLEMITENGISIGKLINDASVKTDWRHSMIQLFAYGCTMVFNRKAIQYYCAAGINNDVRHDNWLYVICAYCGNVIYDSKSYILYRQHEKNLSGKKVKGIKLLFQRLGKVIRGDLGHPFEEMASNLLQYCKIYFNEESAEKEKYLEMISGYRKRVPYKLALLFDSKFSTGKIEKDICIKLRIILGNL